MKLGTALLASFLMFAWFATGYEPIPETSGGFSWGMITNLAAIASILSFVIAAGSAAYSFRANRRSKRVEMRLARRLAAEDVAEISSTLEALVNETRRKRSEPDKRALAQHVVRVVNQLKRLSGEHGDLKNNVHIKTAVEQLQPHTVEIVDHSTEAFIAASGLLRHLQGELRAKELGGDHGA